MAAPAVYAAGLIEFPPRPGTLTRDEGDTALAAFQRRCAPFLFQHSMIAQEVLAGARDEADYRKYPEDWVAPFEDLRRVIAPHLTWTRAALIVARLVVRGQLSPEGFSRSLPNGCPIAASARKHGFILVARNAGDFALITAVGRGIHYQPPWPKS